jgi:hypothetical protein
VPAATEDRTQLKREEVLQPIIFKMKFLHKNVLAICLFLLMLDMISANAVHLDDSR